VAHVGGFENVISEQEQKLEDGVEKEGQGDQDDRFRKCDIISHKDSTSS